MPPVESVGTKPPGPGRGAAPVAGAVPPVSAAELMQIVRLLPDVLFKCHKGPDGKIYWSLNEGGLAEEFHLTTQEIKGKSLEQLFPEGASQAIKEHFEAAFQGSTEEFVNELGGRYFKHLPQPVFGPDGRVESVVGFISEVTALVQAEKDLARANRELESFAYTVSHDLRTPLTVVSSLAQVLQRQAGRLDERGQDAVRRVGEAARRMAEMIADLLEFSRAGRRELHLEQVDLTAMAHEVEEALRLRHADRDVRFEAEPGMLVRADPRLMRIVVENLLGNAWKYTADRQVAHISIGTTTRDGARRVVVRDDGIGFDEDEADRLFEAFRRLSSAERFEGTGIGLSTVARIVERHGGQVGAEGRRGEGAAFWFTLAPEASA